MPEARISLEECPLRKTTACQKQPKTLKGPIRVLRLCILGILMPALLIGIPVYMRYHVYGRQLYPLAMSDMRLLDNKISTMWCQRQLVKVNTTFNAFLLPKTPQLSKELKPLSMVRHLQLEDDTKEYWGFYLLKGSSVTVSTCVRWPGASLIVIRGHKHLHECAYIGDNSSEELDELMELVREKSEGSDEAPANEPDLMKRHRQDVEFHHPSHKHPKKNHTLSNLIDTTDITDSKSMRKILDALQEKTGRLKKQIKAEIIGKPKYTKDNSHVHVHRNSTIAKDETKNLKIQAPRDKNLNKTTSTEALEEIIGKLESLGSKGGDILEKINKQYGQHNKKLLDLKGRHYSKPAVQYNDNIDRARRRKRELILSTAAQLNANDEENDLAKEEGLIPDGIADHRGTVNETTLNDMSNSEFWSSFSSSEEALLNCAGLILNLPLTPHHKCEAKLTEDEAEETYLANTVTYKVPTNGYYFFVFNSENEVQTNYLRVQFNLKKSVYNISNPVAVCKNNTEECAMDLKFFSNEKLVMELPVRENDTLWNEEFIVDSECEPRSMIYLVCVIAVPFLVLTFAFS